MTMSALAPSFVVSKLLVTPVATSTFSAVAPSFLTGAIVGAPAGAWQATVGSPLVAIRLDAPAAASVFNTVTPSFGSFVYVYAVPTQAIFDGLKSRVVIVGSGMSYTYTPGVVWQAPDGDMIVPKTGRIVQSYERF
jgi:hypothetical protein